MATVEPFRGYRYDPAVTGDIGKVIAPPYDVIDAPLRNALLRVSEYNIAHITRADRADGDASGGPYADAAARWEIWRRDGVIKQDDVPAVYVYEQFFEVHGNKFSRTGMIARVRLEMPGKGVLPHEDTLTAPRLDRLDLIRATRSQFGLVFGLYPDAEGTVDAVLETVKASRPLVNAAERDKQFHRIWALTDPDALARIREAMADREILIADGHHRYETSLAYQEEHPECEDANYRMMALVNMSNTGLVVLPIHRLVKGVDDFDPQELLAGLRKSFDLQTYPGENQAVRNAVLDAARAHHAEGRHAFALYMGNGNHHLLVLRDESTMADLAGRSEMWQRLDVTILHHFILEKHLGVTPERLARESNVEYVQDFPHAIQGAVDRVRSGECQALFLLNPTRVSEVQAVAQNRERMPQKSTFFYPKVYTGLVFYCMDG